MKNAKLILSTCLILCATAIARADQQCNDADIQAAIQDPAELQKILASLMAAGVVHVEQGQPTVDSSLLNELQSSGVIGHGTARPSTVCIGGGVDR